MLKRTWGTLAMVFVVGCGSSVRVDQEPDRGTEAAPLDDYELACSSMCDRAEEVCGAEPSCVQTCRNSRESLDPACVAPAEAYWACLGESLWSCVEVPHECTDEIGELELCLSGCIQGAVGELDESGACSCGGTAVAAKNEVSCQLQPSGTLLCDCIINGVSSSCEETVPENACSPVEGCCGS